MMWRRVGLHIAKSKLIVFLSWRYVGMGCALWAGMSETTDRNTEVSERARKLALSQGYSQETADSFAAWIVDYCPEVQSYSNLFDCYMSKQD